MSEQITDSLLMIRPISFMKNEETASNNYFQKNTKKTLKEIQADAASEFDAFVKILKKNGMDVTVFNDTRNPETPDSIFPNNWISFHDDGTVWTYPMYAENRREERREDIIESLRKTFDIIEVCSLTDYEDQDLFLEGTGSMIIDRFGRTVFASLSERTDEEPLEEFCDEMEYALIPFTAYQNAGGSRMPIYHTNVMMTIGEKFAIVCLECIDDEMEQADVRIGLKKLGKEIIEITENQVNNFAGNMLQIRNKKGERFIVMSETAYESLTKDQIEKIKAHGKIIKIPIPTIEKLGGGSVRCMMAEIFLPRKSKK